MCDCTVADAIRHHGEAPLHTCTECRHFLAAHVHVACWNFQSSARLDGRQSFAVARCNLTHGGIVMMTLHIYSFFIYISAVLATALTGLELVEP
jgi:hypothetical protein